MIPRGLRYRAPVLWLLLPLMAGLVAGKVVPFQPPAWALLMVAAGAIAITWRYSTHPSGWAIGLVTGIILAGMAYYQLNRARIEAWEERPPREGILTVQVDRVFAPSADGKRLSGLGHILSSDTLISELVGQKLYFSVRRTPGDSPPVRSSVLSMTGVVQSLPRHPEAGTFDQMLSDAGMNFRLSRGRILALVRPAAAYYRFCDAAQRRFFAILGEGIENRPDLASILRAMLLGQKSELSDDQNQRFMRSGTMHLFVISGLHIGVIALGIQGVAALLRIPQWVRFVLGSIALWLYVDITGGSPSAFRAFAMILCLHSAFAFRLPINPFASLSLGAFIALLINPMEVFSASFQMSYAIVAALLLLGAPLADAWKERWSPFRDLPRVTWQWWHHTIATVQTSLLSALGVGLASALVGAITGVIFFKLFTPGAIIANLILFPVASIVVMSGFLSILSGLVGLKVLSVVLNHAAALVLWAIDRGIDRLVKVPGVYWNAHFLAPWIGYTSCALLVGTMLFGYAHQWDRKRGGFWPPFVVTVLAMIFGVKFD